MWLRSVLHEVQFFVIVPQSNIGQQEMFEHTRVALISFLNRLQMKRRLLYLKTQSVPRCKHFSSRL
jgi:hypothetical protein